MLNKAIHRTTDQTAPLDFSIQYVDRICLGMIICVKLYALPKCMVGL